MCDKKLLRTYIIGLSRGKYTYKQACESTGYTRSWLWHYVKLYKQDKKVDLVHKNTGRIPPNKLKKSFKDKIVNIYVEKYQDVNFKFFTECLNEYEKIDICYTTVRNIFAEYGIKSPCRYKTKKKIVHRPRLRRECEGDMLQLDGTPFAWFYKFGNDSKYCMHGAIDDATSKITALYITENECMYGYFECLRQTINKYGIPREVYSDRAAIFCHTPGKKKNLSVWEQLEGLHDKKTQFQRVCEDLNINQILAWSPEAKGRVERMWSTLQKRLPQLFYLNDVQTVAQANEYLQKYVNIHNAQFAVPAAIDDPFYIDCDQDLDDILCCQLTRRTNHAGEFSFHGYKFCITECKRVACRDFVLCISERGIFARLDGQYWPVQLIDVFQEVQGDQVPQVVKNIIYRYMFAYAKEYSA